MIQRKVSILALLMCCLLTVVTSAYAQPYRVVRLNDAHPAQPDYSVIGILENNNIVAVTNTNAPTKGSVLLLDETGKEISEITLNTDDREAYSSLSIASNGILAFLTIDSSSILFLTRFDLADNVEISTIQLGESSVEKDLILKVTKSGDVLFSNRVVIDDTVYFFNEDVSAVDMNDNGLVLAQSGGVSFSYNYPTVIDVTETSDFKYYDLTEYNGRKYTPRKINNNSLIGLDYGCCGSFHDIVIHFDEELGKVVSSNQVSLLSHEDYLYFDGDITHINENDDVLGTIYDEGRPFTPTPYIYKAKIGKTFYLDCLLDLPENERVVYINGFNKNGYIAVSYKIFGGVVDYLLVPTGEDFETNYCPNLKVRVSRGCKSKKYSGLSEFFSPVDMNNISDKKNRRIKNSRIKRCKIRVENTDSSGNPLQGRRVTLFGEVDLDRDRIQRKRTNKRGVARFNLGTGKRKFQNFVIHAYDDSFSGNMSTVVIGPRK